MVSGPSTNLPILCGDIHECEKKRRQKTNREDVKYIVQDDEGRELLLPAIKSVILEIDLDAGQITVHLLPGLVPGVE